MTDQNQIPANKSWPQSPASPGHLRCFCTIVTFPYNELVLADHRLGVETRDEDAF